MRRKVTTINGITFGISISENHVQISFLFWIIDLYFGKPDDPTQTERRIGRKDRRK